MSAIDTILARTRARSEVKTAAIADPPAWALSAAWAEKYDIPDPSTVERQATIYQQLSWVQTAVETVAQMAASTPFEVRRRGGEESTAIENHPFEERLQRPNPLMSRFEFLEATFSYRRLTGNAYWWLNRPSPDAPPDELWIIPPHQIQPVPDERLYLRGYLYDAGAGQPIPLDLAEVVHFRVFHPLNKFLGLSAIESLRLSSYGDLAAQSWSTNFYGKDNAKVAGFLAFADPIEQTRWDRMKMDTAREYGGTKNRRLMMLRGVGQGGVQWVQTNISQQDMQYLEQRQFTKEEIWSRLAPGLASMLAINANEANARSGESTLRALAVQPALTAVAEKITNDLLIAYGDALLGVFEDVRYKDRALELQEQQAYGAVHTIEEIRQKFYQDQPLGDDRDALLPAEVGKGLTDARDPEEKAKEALDMMQQRAATQPPPPGQNGQQPPPSQPDAETALAQAGKALDRRRWREKVVKQLAAGKAAADVVFDPDYLSDGEAMAIKAALKRAVTVDQVWKAMEG